MNERIRQIRINEKLSQEEFAAKLGYKSRGKIANIEYGKIVPDEEFLDLLCRTFSVNKNWLISGDGEMYEDVSEEAEIATWVSKILADRDETIQKKALNLLCSLDDEGWKAIMFVVEKLGNMQNEEET